MVSVVLRDRERCDSCSGDIPDAVSADIVPVVPSGSGLGDSEGRCICMCAWNRLRTVLNIDLVTA